ncbi:unnamed protein product [Cylindrotheca closterium]|uniref:Uncharacterized protein n=1 Tax=Cylindrotheca closterium TaxID=2856 RepID=A0AAD2CHB5_9STRA|nr:unnamed protein product [Cylindrotheca closterium]
MRYKAKRSEAVYLIKHFLEEPKENLSMPESFLTRGSWASFLGSIQEEEQSTQSGRSAGGNSDNAESSNLDDVHHVEHDLNNRSSGALKSANTTDKQSKGQ